jgi:hypothetical protein
MSVATALLAGCGGSAQLDGPATQIASTDRAKAQDLLYVLGLQMSVVTYPEGKLVTQFSPPGGINGICSDTKGDIFVAGVNVDAPSAPIGGNIYEYAHGGTSPIAILNEPGLAPETCASDPVTGNLAVITDNRSSNFTEVAVYDAAAGNPTIYTIPKMDVPGYATYDGFGNLFVDSAGDGAQLAELPKGSSAFVDITLPQLDIARAILWDGKYLAIQAQDGYLRDAPVRIYRVQVSGSAGTIVGVVSFSGWLSGKVRIPYLRGSRIIARAFANSVGVWRYPAGGKILETFKIPGAGHSADIEAEALSVSPSR